MQLVRIAEINTGVDIVMFDFEAFTNGIISQKSHYLHNDTKEMKGREFLQSQEIPWVPWCYLYRRYLWRIPFSQMVYILRHYRAYVPNNNKWLTFSARYPLIFAIVLQLLKPLFPLMRKIYLSSK